MAPWPRWASSSVEDLEDLSLAMCPGVLLARSLPGAEGEARETRAKRALAEDGRWEIGDEERRELKMGDGNGGRLAGRGTVRRWAVGRRLKIEVLKLRCEFGRKISRFYAFFFH